MDASRHDRDLPEEVKPAGGEGSFTPLKDEVGRRYFRLVVVERAGVRRREATWICKCDCGAETIATGHALRRGWKRSCGCGWRATADRCRDRGGAINHHPR
jgi:hypothetical protein